MVAGGLHCAGDRVQYGHAGAAAHADHRTHLFDVGRPAQGADDILIAVAHLQLLEQGRGFAHYHVNHGEGSLLGVGLGHGERNALAIFSGL